MKENAAAFENDTVIFFLLCPHITSVDANNTIHTDDNRNTVKLKLFKYFQCPRPYYTICPRTHRLQLIQSRITLCNLRMKGGKTNCIWYDGFLGSRTFAIVT